MHLHAALASANGSVRWRAIRVTLNLASLPRWRMWLEGALSGFDDKLIPMMTRHQLPLLHCCCCCDRPCCPRTQRNNSPAHYPASGASSARECQHIKALVQLRLQNTCFVSRFGMCSRKPLQPKGIMLTKAHIPAALPLHFKGHLSSRSASAQLSA